MTQTKTATATYTTADVEKVVRRVHADLAMIADSTGAWTPQQASEYAHDIQALAKEGYLKWVDVTLLSNGIEQQAVRFRIDTDAGSWTSSRPGGVLWPKVTDARLRIVLRYTNEYDDTARSAMKSKLKIGWSPTSADTTHSGLFFSGGRDYSSNAYGMSRRDWTA